MQNRTLRNILLLVMVLAITVAMGSCAHRTPLNTNKEPLETGSQGGTDEILKLVLAVHDEVTSMCDKVEQKIETENRGLKREKERLQVELNGLRTIKAELSKRNGKLEKDNGNLQKEVDRLRSTVELLAKDKAELLKSKIGLTERNDELEAEVDRLNSIITGLIGHVEER